MSHMHLFKTSLNGKRRPIWWLEAVTGAGVNWWRNAWWKTGRRGCRSQCACVTERRRSSRAWIGSGETGTWPGLRAEGHGSTPACSPARGKSWSEGRADVHGGWTQRAPLSSNSYQPCTSGSSALHTGAAGRSYRLGNGCAGTQRQSAVRVENRRLSCCFLRVGWSHTALELAGRNDLRLGQSPEWNSGMAAWQPEGLMRRKSPWS